MLTVMKLSTDYMHNPVGFDLASPKLAWACEADGQNRRQGAYQLQVGLDERFEAPLFDSGKVASDASVGVPFPLTPAPRTRYFWRVRVWDEQGIDSGFSGPAFFETGRGDEPWQADWIGGPGIELPQLRKEFRLDKPISRARIYASGVGLYNLFLNGEKVGDELLTPGFNAYDSWIQYQTYDVTAALRQGENALGAWLGNGYYKGRVNWPDIPTRTNIYGDRNALIAELVVQFADGSEWRVPSDASWKAAESPFLRAEIYDGEVFDARLHDPDWCQPGFDDRAWRQAVPVDIDKRLLAARRSVPVVVVERIAPVRRIKTPGGEDVLDFGQNMGGWVRFKGNAPAGAELKLQFGEALDRDGNFYRDNMRTALAECAYISGGKPFEYAPRFTFFGFRYVKLTGCGGIDTANFTAEVIHSEMERTGNFECSDPRVNRLFLNALWGQKGNFIDTPTDCPQRDERMGWTGDAQVFCATACMNMRADAFYRKYLHDLAIEQTKVGYVPVVVPNILHGTDVWAATTTGWGDAATIMPWTLYLYYGDVDVLAAQYDSMKAWVEYMRSTDTRGVDRYGGRHIGDWLSQDQHDPDALVGLTPTELLATSYYALSAELVAKAASVLGRREDARTYAELAARIRKAFQAEFVTPNGRVASDTQTSKVVALHMSMLPEAQRPSAARQLAERIYEDNLQLTTGFIGTPLLCPTLSENGYNEYAYQLLLSTKCPSWLYEVEHGATTIWERWNSVREDGSFGPVSMNSLNHYAFGSIAEWMYRYCAGINPVESAPGFKRTRIRPMPNAMLQCASAELQTNYGRLRSAWTLSDGKLRLDVEIPFNAEAEIHLPDADGVDVLENGAPVRGTVLARGSGHWRYEYAPTMETIGKRPPELKHAW